MADLGPRFAKRPAVRASILLSLLPLLLGCIQPSDWHEEDADYEVSEIIDEGRASEASTRTVKQPTAGESPSLDPRFASSETQLLSLNEALAVAVKHNRNYLTQKETLYQSGLSLSRTRFDFGPQLSSTLSYVWTDGEFSEGDQRLSATGSISQLLPTGGTATLGGAIGATHPQGRSDHSFDSSVSVVLDQPLLRGVGYMVSHERLTQAERDLLYAVREFELFRQDFSINLAQSYYDLVSQQQTLDNQERTYKEALYDRKKAEALRQVDRNDDEQVFRARRREVVTQASLIDARARYRRGLDEFKILLGLPTTANLDVIKDDPPYQSVRLDPASAVEAARHNRLDVTTARQRKEDAERRAFLAENGLLPQIDLALNGAFGGSSDRMQKAWADEWSFSGGIAVQLPLQLTVERNAYKNSLIAQDRARRAYDLTLDRVGLEVRDQLRQLSSVEQQIQIQQVQILQERRAVAVTEIRYEAGILDNRDLLEARQGLIDAQNALIRLKVDHFIRRLRLLRTLGLLEIDAKGRWR